MYTEFLADAEDDQRRLVIQVVLRAGAQPKAMSDAEQTGDGVSLLAGGSCGALFLLDGLRQFLGSSLG